MGVEVKSRPHHCVDRDGAIRSMDAAAVRRKRIMAPATTSATRKGQALSRNGNDALIASARMAWNAPGHYCRMKLAADKLLREWEERVGVDDCAPVSLSERGTEGGGAEQV